MKQQFFIVFFIIAITGFAQSASDCCNVPFIKVEGSAEMEVIPDEIYLSITLSEDDYKQKTDVLLLEETLKGIVHSLGIEMKNLMIQDASSNFDRGIWKQDVAKTKQYVLLVNSAEMVGLVMNRLDKAGISNVYIQSYTHSKIEALRKQVKIKAMKDAKDKAIYLLEAIGEKAGSPIEIIEQAGYLPAPVLNMSYRKNESVPVFKSSYQDLEFKKIKLQYTIDAKFEIVK